MEFQDEFRDALYKMYEENKRVLVPKELYLKSINDLREASGTTKKTPHQYYLLKKYEILKCGDIDKLIKRRKSAEEVPLYFVTIEDTYDTIKRAHIATGHGGRDKMLHELNKKYANITIDAVSLFKSMCMECQRKRNTEQTLSLRQAVQFESVCGGQGYIRCNCVGAKRCQTNRCKCFKANLKCNSRCHSGLHCSNKLS